jgi:hypothetical protein
MEDKNTARKHGYYSLTRSTLRSIFTKFSMILLHRSLLFTLADQVTGFILGRS